MLKVLTAAQMREVDRLTTERYGIPSILLMENAAHAVARVITEKLGGSVKGKSILILCGPGNNGGDGAALGRLLHADGAYVTVQLFGKLLETRGDARTNFELVKELSEGCRELDFLEEPLEDTSGRLLDDWIEETDFDIADVIVDSLFGTGLNRELAGFVSDLLVVLGEWRRKHDAPKFIAVDIPSGLSADSRTPLGPTFHAHCTVTFTAPKAGNILPPAADFNGELVVAEIGSPKELIAKQLSQIYLADRLDAADWLARTEFTNASYKNKRGHALIIGGSRDYSGAAVLCGNAAIRSGCGLVTVATPESSRESIVQRVSPEVMVRGLAETGSGSAAGEAVEQVSEFLKNVDALAIGSGLSSQEDETKVFVRRIVAERRTPVVIDADGLTALSPWKLDGSRAENHAVGETPPPLLRKEGSPLLPLILTPHEGEFKRLLGVQGDEAAEALKDRVAAVRDFATKHDVILVLKGERALIGAPDGRVVVNPTGNSGLGKAGNGDTLTGILVGFIAQAMQMKIDIFETVVAAVYIAGMAGDVAGKKFGKRVMTASDVRDCLVDVFGGLLKD